MSLPEELRKERAKINERQKRVFENMDKIINESYRISEVAHNAENILNDFERQFEIETKLDKVDVAFLFFATALQCIRQYVLSNEKFRFNNAADGDKFIKKVVPKSYEDILLQSVPYDAFLKADGVNMNTGISGANHRYKTLGHDPLLGWIFGTANIMTDSLTKNNYYLESYKVINSRYISEPVTIIEIFNDAVNMASSDYKTVIAAVLRQAIHFGADAFTKMGLPIPVINNISPDLSSKLLSKECRIDLYSVTRGAAMSSFINTIIGAVHSLFYNENEYINKDMYEVKTRKILSYSNYIASSSNVIYTAISEDLTKLDLGGLMITIYRLMNDYKFIRRVKKEFVFGKFNELIKGEDCRSNEVL